MALSCSPRALLAALSSQRGRALLHSGRNDDELGSWTFVAAAPRAVLEAHGDQLLRRDHTGAVVASWSGDPLQAAERFAAEFGADLRGAGAGGESPRPIVIGYFGYELAGVDARRSSTKLSSRPIGVEPPDLWLGAYGAVARWHVASLGGVAEVDIVGDDVDALAMLRDAAVRDVREPEHFVLGELSHDDLRGESAYRASVQRILAYLHAGDVYQVNLARRIVAQVEHDGDPVALFAALDAIAPAPYGAMIEADGATLWSGSPERFLGREAITGRIETRPIKGTRRRTANPDADAAIIDELRTASKDGAEHLMIVDLVRNDLGRVATVGSVQVDRLGYVVELPHLYHQVSRVSATLRDDVGLAALLDATFPGGSITGAPKIRAMEIIEELEPVPRGPYCGAFGYLGANGGIELAIAIRVAVKIGDELRVHVGGGIVADSDIDAEFDETEAKAIGWRRAVSRGRSR